MNKLLTETERIELGDRVADYFEDDHYDLRFTAIIAASGAVATAELVDANQAA